MLLTALAAALRILWLSDIPPGLYHDEGYNGLDALRVLSGEMPVYFPANNGREPAFIYIVATTVGLLGRTPGALRLAAAVCGTLTIPAAYYMARSWFNRRVTILGTSVLAFTFWHVHLSRIGFRAVTLPLAVALTLWMAARAYRSGKGSDWLLCGLLYGLCFYTYLPIRFTPIAILCCGVLIIIAGKGRQLWPGVIWAIAGLVVSLAPLIVYTFNNWDLVMGRTGQVSVFNPAINEGDLWGTLIRQLFDTLGMFFIRGDTIPRHNLPGRPVFDPLLGVAMAVGLVQIVRNRRRELAPLIAGVWVVVMVIPTWVAEDAPHFLRSVGALPLLPFLPAVGLDGLMTWVERRGNAKVAIALVAFILVLCLGLTVRDYFLVYANDVDVAYAFEDAATELAAEVNRFIGSGWDGGGLFEVTRDPTLDKTVYIDSRLWEEWTSIEFLVPSSDMVEVVSEQDINTEEVNRQGDTLVLVWPYGQVTRFLQLLPPGSRISAHNGPLARGDLEEEVRTAYVSFTAVTDVEVGERVSYFGDSIALAGYSVERDGDDLQVTLIWEALGEPADDYTVFVHLFEGGALVVQHDGLPAGGLYSTALWRPGDVIVDDHILEDCGQYLKRDPKLVVGLYSWPTLDRLIVRSPSGELLGDELELIIEK